MQSFVQASWLKQSCVSLGLCLTLMSCLEAQKSKKEASTPTAPEVVTPEIPAESSPAQVRIQLNKLSLANLPADAASLRVQVYSVVGNVRAEKLGEAQTFSLADASAFRLVDLKAGLYDFALEILGDQDQRLGVAESRALLSSGEQNLTEWNWRWTVPGSSSNKLELNFAFEGESLREPDEVRTILKSSCVGCHSTAKKRGQLILDTYPYKSENPDTAALGLSGIANLNAVRVSDAVEPMPPAPLKPIAEDKRTVLNQFAQKLELYEQIQKAPDTVLGQGELVLILSDKTQIRTILKRDGLKYFVEPVITLATGQEIVYKLTLLKADGSILLEQKEQSFTVPASGSLSLKIDL